MGADRAAGGLGALALSLALLAPAPAGAARALPGFVSRVGAVTPAMVRHTWHPGCPVGPRSLRRVRVAFVGFDHRAHVGTVVVNAAVAEAAVGVFRRLYAARFPIRRMVPEEAYGGSDPASMAADNTSGFNCRRAVTTGAPSWSAHAYGDAIDVDPVENPYVEGGTVQPAAGAAYLDRSRARPGMAEPGGALVAAFAAAGWQWGGRWVGTPDYQHFSSTGR